MPCSAGIFGAGFYFRVACRPPKTGGIGHPSPASVPRRPEIGSFGVGFSGRFQGESYERSSAKQRSARLQQLETAKTANAAGTKVTYGQRDSGFP